MARTNGVSLLAAALASTAWLAPSTTHACGGCFSPPASPTGTVSVVNAHRMAFLSSPSGSILWDQIQYTGSPTDFVWVLPVAGTPTVEVGDNGFFESLVSATNIRLVAPTPPRTSCPPAYCSRGCSGIGCSAPAGPFQTDAAISLADGGPTVQVFHEGVVGPYDTATIGSTDPMALVGWLQAHGYEVPDAMLPTIEHYTSLGMNFIALRLAPRVGIERMAPVRVAFPGLALTLPLRMIAAGVGSEVSLELFVFAEARMEAASFPNAEVDRAAITFDWASRTFDYDARFEDALFAGSGTQSNWVTEYAQAPPLASLAAYTSGVGADRHSAAADMALVMAALPNARLTRLRTRLAASQLSEDLVLASASPPASDIATTILVTHEIHRPADVVCPTNQCGCAAGPGAPPVTLIAIACGLLAFRVTSRRARR